MIFTICYQLIFLLLITISVTTEFKVDRQRRQIPGGTNSNVRIPEQKLSESIPPNSIQLNPSNNPQLMISSQRNDPQQISGNNPRIVPPLPQIETVPNRGFYNNPPFQSPPFSGERPLGWFGTNRANWISTHDSELDKNKLAAQKHPLPNSPQVKPIQPRPDGGPSFLEKVAKEFSSQGDQAFPSNQYPSTGATCSNFDNFNGFVFGYFLCPLPASTGMNPLDQFCCGPANYQYCCNAQEFSQTQRGAFADHTFTGRHGFSTRTEYSSSTKRIITIISPIASVIVLIGLATFVFLYYKKFRKEQYKFRKLPGTIRLEDNDSGISEEPPVEKPISNQDEL